MKIWRLSSCMACIMFFIFNDLNAYGENSEKFKLFQAIKANKNKQKSAVSTGSWEKIDIRNDMVARGVGDPSIEYGPQGIGWMSYSRVLGQEVAIHLAKSTDHGKSWGFVKSIVRPNPGKSLNAKNKPIEGTWDYEMSTILHDPKDKGKEWKIFFNKYLTQKKVLPQNSRLYSNGYIGYKYASNPEGEWSPEVPVFVMGPFVDLKIPNTIDLSKIHPDLSTATYFSEMGSLVKNGVIYLCMDARSTYELGDWNLARIILVASYDHGKSWKYLGTLTDYSDAEGLGYVILTGSSLIEDKGNVYLLASPSGSIKPPHKGHEGILIFEMEDLDKAKLKRDSEGKLIVKKHIKPLLTKGGQADYDQQNTYGGIIVPQQHPPASPEMFQIFSTKEIP